jgi:nitrite reductase (NADH) small subunit
MNGEDWIRIAPCEDLPLREGRTVILDGRQIAIFNLGDRFLAVDNQCPHKGGPLADGIVSGGSVVCPLHAWKVDLATGCVERPSDAGRCIRTYDVRVDNGILALRLCAASADEEGGEDRAA